MTRVIFALLLLGIATAEPGPHTKWEKILDWMKAHGEDVIEGVQECAPLPQLIKKMYEESSKCQYEEHRGLAMAASALVYTMNGLEHVNGTFVDAVKKNILTKAILSWAETEMSVYAKEAADKMCHQSECIENSKTLASAISPCYASVFCAGIESMPFPPSMKKNMANYGECKAVFREYLDNLMDQMMDNMCVQDVSTLPGEHEPYYCSRMYTDVMAQHMDCYSQLTHLGFQDKMSGTPVAKFNCDPKCVQMWSGVKDKFPKCSSIFMGWTEGIAKGGVKMADKLFGLKGGQKIDIKNFDELCMSPSSHAKALFVV